MYLKGCCLYSTFINKVTFTWKLKSFNTVIFLPQGYHTINISYWPNPVNTLFHNCCYLLPMFQCKNRKLDHIELQHIQLPHSSSSSSMTGLEWEKLQWDKRSVEDQIFNQEPGNSYLGLFLNIFIQPFLITIWSFSGHSFSLLKGTYRWDIFKPALQLEHYWR